ncbi:DUF1835 domain-containing protein [Bacillus cereus group sp. BfR-BA-01380]|uniref:DUF1835 domain-containing protein n=1 Tax=Bacillus cereus group sp. BfR-BA-01380 TaxID=2920324 RepID=UPI001F598AF6|nr:DUF1835 domain-containing protein [Bacillus cereus group sp. BfR-BA-01380]
MLKHLQKAINHLTEGEAKELLFKTLTQLHSLETKLNKEELSLLTTIPTELIEQYIQKTDITKSKHVHIIFGQSAAGSLKYAFKKANIQEEHVLCFSDTFSVGPLFHLDEEVGQVARQQWLQEKLLIEGYCYEEYLPEMKAALEKLQAIPSHVPITIWTGNNAYEHVGLIFVLYVLKDITHNVYVINTADGFDKLFRKPNLDYTVRHTGEIVPEKLIAIRGAYKEQNPLTKEERQVLENEWETLREKHTVLRIWEKNRVVSVSEDYIDHFIVQCARSLETDGYIDQFYKAARLVGEVLGHFEQYVGDSFIEYRLKTLIQKGIFHMTGSLHAMRFYSVRLAQPEK